MSFCYNKYNLVYSIFVLYVRSRHYVYKPYVKTHNVAVITAISIVITPFYKKTILSM